jgi:hypothetical protein
MKAEAFLLVALSAPGSIEAELGRVQAGIFAEHGLASAQALPPLIPVAFPRTDAHLRGLLAELNRAARAPWRIQITGHAWVEGFLYLRAESGGMLTALRARALDLCGEEPRRLFPPFEGFFMGCAEASPAQRELIHPTGATLAFTSCAIAVMSIETPPGDREWWREVYWETVEQRPLRGRREE